VTLFAVACSWFAVKMQQARRQREAVEAIRKIGGFVVYDYEINLEKGSLTRIQGAIPPSPAWLRKVLGEDFYQTVAYVNFADSEIIDIKGIFELHANPSNLEVTETGLEPLEELKQLRALYLSKTQITDAGLQHLKELNKLNILFLEKTIITDIGLKYLKGLTQLQNLDLDETRITDAGLEQLKELKQLRSLRLSGTQITDAGLKHLKGLNKLESLNITRTKTSNAGIKDLQQALPNLKIERY
jgi:Leucine-rich repeat (LRR) protein